MLNRFKNAIYGSSTATVDYISQDGTTGRRGNSNEYRVTRSSSFREDLVGELRRNRNSNSSNGAYNQPRSKDLDNIQTQGSALTLVSQHSNSANDGSNEFRHSYKVAKLPKFKYSRPSFLQLKTDDEILVSADHQIRPIILPRDVSRLPWKSGYAECINAGKSLRNEDQAAVYQDVAVQKSNDQTEELGETSIIKSYNSSLPWVYFGIFDGHAGTAVAVAAASQLHNIISTKLCQVADLLVSLEFDVVKDEDDSEYLDCMDKMTSKSRAQNESEIEKKKECEEEDNNNTQPNPSTEPTSLTSSSDHKKADEQKENSSANTNDSTDDCSSTNNSNQPSTKPTTTQDKQQKQAASISPERRLPSMIDICRNNVTVDSLITGTLESAFWEMDSLIARDKQEYKMAGGCTAIVGLFILGKLYVCNAGDSRAIIYKNNQVIPMSFDFTPISERERILRLALQQPEFLGNDFTHLEFIRRPTRRDLGKQLLYKDAYMTGWSMKTITYDDLKFPLVWGEGKRSRVLATIGVTRGFGDHELRAQYGAVLIKPFLTPEPEVKVLPLENDEQLTAQDVLIMGSDGLWDVTGNQEAADIVKNSFDLFPDNEESRSKYRYITAAQDLVIHSRGHTTNWNNVWRTADDKLASLDDIAVFVIPLKQYRDEYLEWKRLRAS